ncbi:usherin [Hypanus sabinus]|uniref:usherin n=1 Tax=Hypanus sabinus TaxID=79690 RepID=UPI0028C46583|nr:usherin [Hypanus sabinus]
MGSTNTPIINLNPATDVGPILPTVDDKTGVPQSNIPFYHELWFIILMAILGLMCVAIFLSILLQKAVNKQPYKRERPPLIPLKKRTNLPNESFMFDAIAATSDASSSVTLKSYTMCFEGLTDTKISEHRSHMSNCNMSVIHVPSRSQLGHTSSQTSLHRSVSQLVDTHDKKSLMESSVWEFFAQGRDSGMYPDDDELLESIKGFSSVTKEHTIFTDTQL